MLSFLTLNIERRKHLDLIKPFLRASLPDVMCFQEIFEDTFEELKTEFQLEGFFSGRATLKDEAGAEGIAILSKFPIKNSQEILYDQFSELSPEMAKFHLVRPIAKVLAAEIEKDNETFHIATTHFTWSNHGETTEEQRVNVQALLRVTSPFRELILAGDFNAPRGKEIYATLSEHFQDNIPPFVETTIDGERHRAGQLQLMVDGVFSRGYAVSNVEVRSGLSDHCGITATIEKTA